MTANREAGFTLLELLIAVSLVALLSTALVVALRVGLDAQEKTDRRFAANRRIEGAQRALESEIAGFIPETAQINRPESGLRRVPFFEGRTDGMRLVSSYSLADAHRGLPQILEFAVIPGDNGRVRLIVDELPYRGPESAAARIASFEANGTGPPRPVFFPTAVGAGSFVLADQLSYCRFVYLARLMNPTREEWRGEWAGNGWPIAVRIEMAAADPSPALLHPVSVTAPLRAFRDSNYLYGDQPGLQ